MLATIDIVIVGVYALALFFLAQWVSRSSGTDKNASDYFLAGKSLPWWAIGASLIAANISAEQIIGMSGSGYAIGLAIASYEWMAAITLILVGKYLLPVFLRAEIYTMPQFLQQRYDHRVRLVMAFFWLGVYVLVNLTSVLWLGALAINTVAGVELNVALLLLGVFAAGYSLYGGLKAVALTDIIQVVLLVLGGLLISWILLNKVSDGAGVLAGFGLLMEQAPEKFDMILSEDSPHYMSLPGLSVLIGGMWVMNVSYWGFNQYIIQRALAAKSHRRSAKGYRLRCVSEATDASHRGVAGYRRFRTWRRNQCARPSLSSRDDPVADGHQRTGVCGIVGCHRVVLSVDDEQYFDDLHHGHLPVLQQRGRISKSGACGPDRRASGHAHCHGCSPPAAG
jgi:SSS family solute:Na+ symporter